MSRVWRNSGPKSRKNHFLPRFLVPNCLFFFLSLYIVAFGHHYSHHCLVHHDIHHKQSPNHLTWWSQNLSLSLSPLCKNLILCHRDLNTNSSSSNHHFQRLSSLPTIVRATTLSSATPTAPTMSNSSTDHDSNNNSGGQTLHHCHR